MANLEVEPLGVPFGVHIVLQPEVVFNVIHLDGPTEVASFETRLENQNVILVWHVDCVLVIGLTYNLDSLVPNAYTTIEFSLWSKFGEVLK